MHSVCNSSPSFCKACARLCFCPEDMVLLPKRCDSRDRVVAFALSAADAFGLERCSSLTVLVVVALPPSLVLVCYVDVAALQCCFVAIFNCIFHFAGTFVSHLS